MSLYTDCQASAITILQAMTTQFPNSWQVTKYDFGVLDKGLPPSAANAAVTTPGSFSESAIRPEVANVTDDILIDLFTAYTDPATSFEAFTILREAVRTQLHKYPTLSGVVGIQNIVISSTGDPVAIDHRNQTGTPSTPTFIVQTLRLNIEWQGRIAGGEYG